MRALLTVWSEALQQRLRVAILTRPASNGTTRTPSLIITSVSVTSTENHANYYISFRPARVPQLMPITFSVNLTGPVNAKLQSSALSTTVSPRLIEIRGTATIN
jgi:hypothetical protein